MSLFHAYSIRGVYNTDLTDSVAERLGAAFGTFLRQQGMRRVAVARDMRLSSPPLCLALQNGLLSTGCEVLYLGMVSTPQLNFSTDFVGADAGVMVTASHNPPEDNGFKLRTDHTILGEELSRIEGLFCQGQFIQEKGRVVKLNTTAEYISALKARVHLTRPLRVIVDAGNGMAGPLAHQLFTELGCEVQCMYCDPDGAFPHHHPNPVDPKNLDDLVTAVRTAIPQVDVGLAYDGDGDRVGIVTNQGEKLTADYLMILLARHLFAFYGTGKVVMDAMSSKALVDEITQLGGEPIISKVGYAFVQEEMKLHDARLAGELAGHVFVRDSLFRFDDSMLASCILLEILSRKDHSLSTLLSNVPRYHVIPEVRIEVPNGQKFAVINQVWKDLKDDYEINDTDGVRINFEQGWAIIRASQTQEAVVYKAEAQSNEELHRIASLIKVRLERALDDVASC